MISMTEDEFHFEGVVLGFQIVVCGSVLQIFTFFISKHSFFHNRFPSCWPEDQFSDLVECHNTLLLNEFSHDCCKSSLVSQLATRKVVNLS